MARGDVIADTSFLVALYDLTDQYHSRAVKLLTQLDKIIWVPSVVLTEAAYLLQSRGGGLPSVLRRLAQAENGNFALFHLEAEDYTRVREILMQYADNELDFVDACVLTAAERRNVVYVCTFDVNDFSRLRPRHTAYLMLLPLYL